MFIEPPGTTARGLEWKGKNLCAIPTLPENNATVRLMKSTFEDLFATDTVNYNYTFTYYLGTANTKVEVDPT